jgi:hypothetical protein
VKKIPSVFHQPAYLLGYAYDAAALMMPMTWTARPIADASPASSIIQQVSEDI